MEIEILSERKGVCYCGPTWPTRDVERPFWRTGWWLGPYAEYRCAYCGNMALYDTERDIFMVQIYTRSVWDTQEQAKWYSKHCSS